MHVVPHASCFNIHFWEAVSHWTVYRVLLPVGIIAEAVLFLGVLPETLRVHHSSAIPWQILLSRCGLVSSSCCAAPVVERNQVRKSSLLQGVNFYSTAYRFFYSIILVQQYLATSSTRTIFWELQETGKFSQVLNE